MVAKSLLWYIETNIQFAFVTTSNGLAQHIYIYIPVRSQGMYRTVVTEHNVR